MWVQFVSYDTTYFLCFGVLFGAVDAELVPPLRQRVDNTDPVGRTCHISIRGLECQQISNQ